MGFSLEGKSRKSKKPFYEYKGTISFQDYVKRTQNYLFRERVFVDESRKKEEVFFNSPFEIKKDCADKKKIGFLLFHGVTDSPFVWKETASHLGNLCIWVRGVLIPGHGTKREDLTVVTSEDWIQSAQTHYDKFRKKVNKLYLGGFSLGGVLSVMLALERNDVSGLLLIAPALELRKRLQKYSWFLPIYSLFSDFLFSYKKRQNPVKYESFPSKAASNLIDLQKKLRKKLKEEKILIPTMMILSESDSVIDENLLTEIFNNDFKNQKNRLIVYADKYGDFFKKYKNSEKIILKNSYLPERNILNFSHISLTHSPENIIYGEKGRLGHCYLTHARVSRETCLKSKEVYRTSFRKSSDGRITTRLTFNPYFDDFLKQLNGFIE